MCMHILYKHIYILYNVSLSPTSDLIEIIIANIKKNTNNIDNLIKLILNRIHFYWSSRSIHTPTTTITNTTITAAVSTTITINILLLL